jgi:hypothetical protein
MEPNPYELRARFRWLCLRSFIAAAMSLFVGVALVAATPIAYRRYETSSLLRFSLAVAIYASVVAMYASVATSVVCGIVWAISPRSVRDAKSK